MPRNECQPHAENPKALTNQGTHNFPNSGTLELRKLSNLTFRGSLTDTTPVLDNALKCILVICLCGRYLLITMLNLYN